MGNSTSGGGGNTQIMLANIGNATSLGVKTAAGVAVVAGSLNPVILPATAAVLFTVAVYFTLKGMHLRFISYLTTTVGQLKDMFFFIMWMQDIVRFMIEDASDSSIAGQIKGFNLHTKQFQTAIQLLNEVLKKFAPPSIQSDLQQDASPAEAAPKTSFSSRIKSSTRNVFGVAYRFLNSSVLLKKVERLFQNVIVAFQIMQARFFLLLNLHSETFNKIKGKFMESESFKKDQAEGDGTLSQSFLEIASPFKDKNPPPPPDVMKEANDTADGVKASEGALIPAAAPAAGGARSRRLRKTLKRRVLGNWKRKLLKLLLR